MVQASFQLQIADDVFIIECLNPQILAYITGRGIRAGVLHMGTDPVHINSFDELFFMSSLMRFLKAALLDEDDKTGQWVRCCEKCGELLATDKPYLIESHKKWCRV